MDCPICYERINYSAIGTCTHHFCFTCLINWCKQGGELCPICNTRIETIRQDIEFDKLNGSLDIEMENLVTITKINFPKETEAGITLENNYSILMGKRLPGVKVIKINKNKQCYKGGIRYGDIILFINKIPCVNHEQVIQIFNNAIKSNSIINLVLDRNN
tara:strand:+ start:1897 stop:2376 length:480 start_codon:yes stop_codon:yes gene_type:complete